MDIKLRRNDCSRRTSKKKNNNNRFSFIHLLENYLPVINMLRQHSLTVANVTLSSRKVQKYVSSLTHITQEQETGCRMAQEGNTGVSAIDRKATGNETSLSSLHRCLLLHIHRYNIREPNIISMSTSPRGRLYPQDTCNIFPRKNMRKFYPILTFVGAFNIIWNEIINLNNKHLNTLHNYDIIPI